MTIDFIAFDGQVMSFFTPVAEYDALAMFAVDFDVMEIGAMGVTMDQDIGLVVL